MSLKESNQIAGSAHRRFEDASAGFSNLRCVLLLALAFAPALASAASDTIFFDGFERSSVYDVSFATNTPITSGNALLATINVPAGSYVGFVRMEVLTGSTPPSSGFRFDCTLSPGFDSISYTVGVETDVERYLSLQGAVTLASTGNIQIACHDGNGGSSTLLSGKLTVLSASAVN